VYNWRTHAHRKVLIGCCPALHDAIYWLRVQYPVARDNIEQKSWVAVAVVETSYKGRWKGFWARVFGGRGRSARAATLVYAKRPAETLLALCFLTAFGIATATHNNYKDPPGCPALPSMVHKVGTVSGRATDTVVQIQMPRLKPKQQPLQRLKKRSTREKMSGTLKERKTKGGSFESRIIVALQSTQLLQFFIQW